MSFFKTRVLIVFPKKALITKCFPLKSYRIKTTTQNVGVALKMSFFILKMSFHGTQNVVLYTQNVVLPRYN